MYFVKVLLSLHIKMYYIILVIIMYNLQALKSLRKYPLPLKTGKECLILENFGTRICLLLDKKLADYKKNHNIGETGVYYLTISLTNWYF